MPLRRGGALPLSAPRAAAGGLRGGGGRGAALLHPTCLSPPGTTGRALGLRLALLIVVFYPLLEFCYKIKKKETKKKAERCIKKRKEKPHPKKKKKKHQLAIGFQLD
jgi:hypothetical protein